MDNLFVSWVIRQVVWFHGMLVVGGLLLFWHRWLIWRLEGRIEALSEQVAWLLSEVSRLQRELSEVQGDG